MHYGEFPLLFPVVSLLYRGKYENLLPHWMLREENHLLRLILIKVFMVAFLLRLAFFYFLYRFIKGLLTPKAQPVFFDFGQHQNPQAKQDGPATRFTKQKAAQKKEDDIIEAEFRVLK